MKSVTNAMATLALRTSLRACLFISLALFTSLLVCV